MFTLPRTSGIYCIICIPIGKIYVGSALTLSGRRNTHFSELRSRQHHNRHLQRAFDKYGESAFKFEVLEECSVDNLIEREQWWIDNIFPEFNICKTAGSTIGRPNSPETRAKMSIAKKGTSLSPEVRKKIGMALKGMPLSPETRAKISNSRKGMVFSDETRARMSEARKGIAPWNKGKTMSPESRAKMSLARKNRRSKGNT